MYLIMNKMKRSEPS